MTASFIAFKPGVFADIACVSLGAHTSSGECMRSFTGHGLFLAGQTFHHLPESRVSPGSGSPWEAWGEATCPMLGQSDCFIYLTAVSFIWQACLRFTGSVYWQNCSS